MDQPLARLEDQYEIVAKIKEGGVGAIYQVRHRLLDELRIVKVLRPQWAGDAELTARLAKEARAAIKLRHPNIVQIFDFTLDEATGGLIVMEYIRGVDLRRLIHAQRRPSLPLALEIAHQGLRALGYLHRHGFVHRDVSPDNLMLSADVEGRPLVKLIDLGIAKDLGDSQQLSTSGLFIGKLRYASPEHFGSQGPIGIDARSDLYCFALVFYELLTGRHPIPGDSPPELIAGHLYSLPADFDETDPAGRIPGELRRTLLRALAKEPGERFASADLLLAELQELRAGFPLDEACCDEARQLIACERDAPAPLQLAAREASQSYTTAAVSAVAPKVFEEERLVRDLIRRAGLAFEGANFAEAAAHLRAALDLRPTDRWISARLQEAEERQSSFAALLEQAERARANDDFLKARLLVAEALELRPGDAQATALAAALDRQRISPVEPLTPEAERHLSEIRRLRADGHPLTAWRAVKEALAELGDVEPFRSLQQQIAEDLLGGPSESESG